MGLASNIHAQVLMTSICFSCSRAKHIVYTLRGLLNKFQNLPVIAPNFCYFLFDELELNLRCGKQPFHIIDKRANVCDELPEFRSMVQGPACSVRDAAPLLPLVCKRFHLGGE